MNYTRVAKLLLEDINGVCTEKNINALIDVFEAFVSVRDVEWEHWLAKETEDTLAYYSTVCECGRKIRINRTAANVATTVL